MLAHSLSGSLGWLFICSSSLSRICSWCGCRCNVRFAFNGCGMRRIKCALLLATDQDIAQWGFCLCLYWHLPRIQCDTRRYISTHRIFAGWIENICIRERFLYTALCHTNTRTHYFRPIKRWKLKLSLFNISDKVVCLSHQIISITCLKGKANKNIQLSLFLSLFLPLDWHCTNNCKWRFIECDEWIWDSTWNDHVKFYF